MRDVFPAKLYSGLSEYQRRFASLEIAACQDMTEFRQRAAYYSTIMGCPSYHSYFSGIQGPNQTGHQNNYFTHCFYLYQGKAEPQLVRAILNIAKLPPRAVVLDPFCGSGTTLLETNLMGYNAVGIDVNPVACLISRVKTSAYTIPLAALTRCLEDCNLQDILERWPIPAICHDTAIAEQFSLLVHLAARSDHRYLGTPIAQARERVFRRYLAILDQFHEIKGVFERFRFGMSSVLCADSILLRQMLPPASIDAVVTSPPYGNALDYVTNDLHALQFLRQDIPLLRSKMLGDPSQSFAHFWDGFKAIMGQLFTVLKDRGHLILSVGSGFGMADKCRTIANQAGFSLTRHEKIPRETKRGKFAEHVLFFEKGVN